MKCLYLIMMVWIAFVGCRSKEIKESSADGTSDSLKLSAREAIALSADSGIVPEALYLNLDSIKIGDPFADKTKAYGYYRLLFSTSEETHSFWIEQIQIVGDGVVKLKRRFKISGELLGLEYDSPNIRLVSWETPKRRVIEVDGKLRRLDITKMKIEETAL